MRNLQTLLSALVVLALALAGSAHAGDGAVALQTAAPSCPDDSGDRYVSCSNGTVTDNDTGLVWLANANCFGAMDWFEAMAAVAGLSDLPEDAVACVGVTPDQCDCGLSDGSSPGEWRLPSTGEWEAMVEHADDMGCVPAMTNDAGSHCWDFHCVVGGGCSFHGLQSTWYWSSSLYLPGPTWAWVMDVGDGDVETDEKVDGWYVWPVRGGQ